jgi:hypothetical protein
MNGARAPLRVTEMYALIDISGELGAAGQRLH